MMAFFQAEPDVCESKNIHKLRAAAYVRGYFVLRVPRNVDNTNNRRIVNAITVKVNLYVPRYFCVTQKSRQHHFFRATSNIK